MVEQRAEGGLAGRSHPSVAALVTALAQRQPDATALAAPGRAPLSCRALAGQVAAAARALRGASVERGDRVAIVLPNGPEMASAFLSVACCAAAAPLNPAYRPAELEFYLTDLAPRALVVADPAAPAAAVARRLGIRVLLLAPRADGPAGAFALEGPGASGDLDLAGAADEALVLHTSGTTSRPKMVPLTHRNLCASAANVGAGLGLGPADRCLNVMPLFHIHGLVGALLSSLAAGGSVACAPGFDAARLLDWLRELEPSWYTAVPTIHQAALARVRGGRLASSLRFIRSCSAPLPPPVMAELEEAFGVPVIEAYGMTEAAHQLASNPLPPGVRKPGSVGLPTGVEVAIADDAGRLLPAGARGEVVVRGPNVTAGYCANPAANTSAFRDGWFRTGDQGYRDDGGYLFLTGRLKEIINRGGEKIAPREVDEALLAHPAVGQALAFALPHPKLGEEIAAAVVLRPGARATERELQQFAARSLADFKVPRRIVLVEEIPKGPTGKPQRIGLAAKLEGALRPPYVAPRTPVERRLAGIWARALRVERVGIHDDFFVLGGDSLLAAQVLAECFERDVLLSTLFEAPTIAQLARELEPPGAGRALPPSLVVLREGPPVAPIFLLPGSDNRFGALPRYLGRSRPVYGIRDQLDGPTRVEELAARLVEEVRAVQPEGPYLLVGICSGAASAFEMAQALVAQGERVALLAFVEPTPPYGRGLRAYLELAGLLGRFAWGRLRQPSRAASELSSLGRPGQRSYLRSKLKFLARWWASRSYAPRPYPGRLELFVRSAALDPRRGPRLDWRELAAGCGVHEARGAQLTLLDDEHAAELATEVDRCLARALAPEEEPAARRAGAAP